MFLSECFFEYNYAVIPLDDVETYHGVNRIVFQPFKTFREAMYHCRHLCRLSIYYTCDGLYPELSEKHCLHFAIVNCSRFGLSIINYCNLYFDHHGQFATVSFIGRDYHRSF